MKLGTAIAEIMKREGIEILCGYPVNHLIEHAAKAEIRPVMVRQERVGVHMADAISRWNARRRENGLKPMYLGIGLHHGDAVLGDIGSERRMEFAVIGDTVNVASRIQEMTRALDVAILASDGVVQAARAEAGDAAIKDFSDRGEHELRGRTGKIRLWSRPADKV